MSKKNIQMLKISELAKMSGVSLPTIKHYLKEGLIPAPLKTGRTMAYYDRETVNRIILIKKLQHEKSLSLEAIKRVIDIPDNDSPDMKMVQAMMKSTKLTDIPPVPESQIESRSDYPMAKIKAMEEAGILVPSIINGEKYYDSMDVRMIMIIKEMESAGMTLNYTIDTFVGYYMAIKEAAEKALKVYIRNSLGDMGLEQSIKIITAGSDLVDEFILLSKHKVIRQNAESGMKDFALLKSFLETLNFIPIKGDELPDDPPEHVGLRLIYYLLQGNSRAMEMLLEKDPKSCKPFYNAAVIMADFLRGDMPAALENAKKLVPMPTSRHMDNAAAALAYIYSLPDMPGMATPLLHTKKVMAYLRRIETVEDPNPVIDLASKYICACYYATTPSFFENCEQALQMIENLQERIEPNNLRSPTLPTWLERTLIYEVVPAMSLRLHRFAAICLLKLKRYDEAGKSLDMIINIAPPDGEFAEWARTIKYRMSKDPKKNPLYE